MFRIVIVIFLCIVGNIPYVLSAENQGFIKNNGQIVNSDGVLQNNVNFTSKVGNTQIYFHNNYISYYFSKKNPKTIDCDNKTISKADSIYFFRMDLEFIDANENFEIIAEDQNVTKSNYYLAHCPNGINDVPHYNSITYINIYENVDIRFYQFKGAFKYDIILHPGAKLSECAIKV